MTIATQVQLQTIWLGRKTKSESIADALKFLEAIKMPKSPLDQGKIQVFFKTYLAPNGEWVDLDTSDRFKFVCQCQSLGLNMSSGELLELLDSYFGDDK